MPEQKDKRRNEHLREEQKRKAEERRKAEMHDRVDEASDESFPASDSPSWNP